MGRVFDLPERGTLLVATDLQGNLRDFERLRAYFEEHKKNEPNTYLLLTGDLIHGPELSPGEWPEHLGSYYLDASDTVLERAYQLQQRFPHHVIYLLGNHEHAHVGGPTVGKFFPDESARLEQILGVDRAVTLQAWLRTWPLVAIAKKANICLLHAAPHAAITSREQVDNLSLDSLQPDDMYDLPSASVLGAILWARSTSEARARAFLQALGGGLKTAIYGHDVVREGFVVEGSTRLCLSSSFGCYDGDKLYLEWDLAQPVASAYDLAERGLRRLWPEAVPVYLNVSLLLPDFCRPNPRELGLDAERG